MKKLAIISTHPIQYNAPFFRLLHSRANVEIKVFYTWGEQVLDAKFDPGFGRVVDWDIPLLDGYNYEFVRNISKHPGTHHFYGIRNVGLKDAVNNYDPDAVLIYGWAFHSHLKMMRYYSGRIPVFFRGDSHLLDKVPFWKGVIRRLFLKWIYSKVDFAFYAGSSNYDYFRFAGIPEKQLMPGPHAVDNGRFRCESTDCLGAARAVRSSLNIREDALVYLFAGKLESKKDPFLLLEAFVSARLPEDACLIVVGSGHLESSLKEQYSHLSQIKFISFINQSQMPALYKAADVFVLPSKGPGETWGLAVNEAMASGRAVIISDKCGCAVDLVQQGRNGFVFSSGNKAELVNYIRYFYMNREKLPAMQQHSLELITNFTFEKFAISLETAMSLC